MPEVTQSTGVTPQVAPAFQSLPPQQLSIPGINITSSGNILRPDTRIAQLIYSPSGYGKTRLAGGLDALTQKYCSGRRTLFIQVEAGEGGGAATIRDLDVPMYVPKDYTDLYKVLGLLRNDKSIAGIVLDSATELTTAYIKPAALKYPCKENSATRSIGIPTRSDYQTMGEMMSGVLRLLIGMTTDERQDYRKHLIVTAADMAREEDERVTYIGPALPGRMSKEAVQMFQQVGSITIKPQVVAGKRVNQRYLSFQGDGVRAMKDRYGIFPEQIALRAPDGGDGEDLTSIYEKYWLPALAV